MKIIIYTDGSSRGNPGPGGWATIILTEGKEGGDDVAEFGGRETKTTNNRMELLGAIVGLREVGGTLAQHGVHVEVHTDSEYVKKGITEWIDGWIKKGWKTSTKKDVLNKDLWQLLKGEEDRLKQKEVHVAWKYVQAHVGIPLNERADTIATACADNASDLQLYRGAKSNYTVV